MPPSFIVFPLYLESILTSLVSAVIALLGLKWLEGALFAQITAIVPALQYRGELFSLSAFGQCGLVVGAILIGLLGTWLSVTLFQPER